MRQDRNLLPWSGSGGFSWRTQHNGFLFHSFWKSFHQFPLVTTTKCAFYSVNSPWKLNLFVIQCWIIESCKKSHQKSHRDHISLILPENNHLYMSSLQTQSLTWIYISAKIAYIKKTSFTRLGLNWQSLFGWSRGAVLGEPELKISVECRHGPVRRLPSQQTGSCHQCDKNHVCTTLRALTHWVAFSH